VSWRLGGKNILLDKSFAKRLNRQTPEMLIGLFFVLVVVLVLVIEKIELVKPVAKRMEDENDISAR
jgi:hypothetical protein